MHPFFRSFLSLLVVASVSVGFAAPARADYAMPTLEVGLKGVTVIDATILRFDETGHAILHVHDTWAGTHQTAKGYGVRYTCFGGAWSMMGAKAGQRYVLVMVKDSLLEEQSFFEITETTPGDLQVKMKPFYSQWLSLPQGTLPVATVKQRLVTLVQRYAAPSSPSPSTPRP